MTNEELIKALRCEKDCDDCAYHTDNAWSRCDEWGMRCDAADALKAAEQRISELEAQLPKEGEWSNRRTWTHDGEWYCTACDKEITIYMGEKRGNDRYKYCPNCGARMRTVTIRHTLEEGKQ